MAYAALTTLMTIAAGEVVTAAVMQQINDNGEAHEDPPACSIKETTAQAVTTGSTGEAMTADEENFDNDSMHSTVTNTARMTIQTAGRYLFFPTMQFAGDATITGQRVIALKVDGTTEYEVQRVDVSTTGAIVVSGVKPLVLTAGQYVEAWAKHSVGSDLNVTLLDFTAIRFTR